MSKTGKKGPSWERKRVSKICPASSDASGTGARAAIDESCNGHMVGGGGRGQVQGGFDGRRAGGIWTVLTTTVVLAFLVTGFRSVEAGSCAFVQECFQSGVDTDCTPAPADGSQSFPMDSANGFGVAHDTVWDGSLEDPSSGLCQQGTPDAQGRCMVDFVTPKGLEPVAPIICPQYAGDSCCSWQQNYALYQNLRTLVDSFGSTTGCLACAVNLVNFWCSLICSPDQGSFVSIHDPPYAERADDLTGGRGRVLQADVVIDGDTACRIYDSCKSVAIVGETTAMQSGLGLLKFQMQTGAVGHGEYFFLSFGEWNVTPESVVVRDATPLQGRQARQASRALDARTSKVGERGPPSLDLKTGEQGPPFLYVETLSCESFYDPGSSTVPFAYPPEKEHLTSCRCDYCEAACSGGGAINVDVSNDRPIPVLDGFGFGLVGGVYAAVATCTAALFWWRRRQLKDKTPPFLTSIQS
eukprot:jgi/Undpi1/3027/HiC_scaffold_14.g06404.m1